MLVLDDDASRPALFHAFAPDAAQRPAQRVPLYEFVDAAGTHAYALGQELAGFARSAHPLAYVWRAWWKTEGHALLRFHDDREPMC